MGRAYSDIAFTPAVRAVQTRMGSRSVYAPLDRTTDRRDALTADEGIMPALESAHALGYLLRDVKAVRPDSLVILNLSGRGDKDVENVLRAKGLLGAGPAT